MIRISDIQNRPTEYHDKLVTVSGIVEEVITLPILGIGVYKLNDGTGEIWVKPADEAPYKSERVKVNGVIKVGLTISGRTFGLILIEGKSQEQ